MPIDDPILIEMLRGYRRFWLPRDYWAFRSVDDFRERRPGYDPTFFEEALNRARGFRRIGEELRIWQSLPQESKEMLVLAALITRRLNIPEQNLGSLMLRLRKFFD